MREALRVAAIWALFILFIIGFGWLVVHYGGSPAL